jgi:hypothetical protein
MTQQTQVVPVVHIHHSEVAAYQPKQLTIKHKPIIIAWRGIIMAAPSNWKQDIVLIAIIFMLFVKST